MRYSAFISYNHRDEAHARWLHRALESYRIPRHLRGQPGYNGEVIAARLKPVFRDRDEVTPSADLAQVVQAALAESQSLVVVCSPAGARSKWVNAEIRHFAGLGRRNRIFCIIVDGEPLAADSAQECFPAALFDDGSTEPLAADIRPRRDSRDEARLRLVASILGLNYDELRRRDQARRVRRLTAIAAGAVAGVLVTGGLAIAAHLARNEAVRQRDIARERSVTAERTVDFVKGMFAVADPSEALGSTITAREILERGENAFAEALKDEPVVRAEIGLTLSEVYGALGLYRESDRLVKSTGALPQEARTVRARQSMLEAESRFRLGEYDAALEEFGRAVGISRADDNARETLLARALLGLGQTLSALDRFDEAAAALRESVSLHLARGNVGRRDAAYALAALGENALAKGALEEARPFIERSNQILRSTEGELSPNLSDNLGRLAAIAYLQGRNEEAEHIYRSRLAIDEKVQGVEHPDVATTLNNLGRLLLERRAFDEAEPLLERAVRIAERERGGGHDDMAFLFANLAIARQGLGRNTEAEPLFERARSVAEAHRHRMLAPILADLASIACRDDRAERGLGLIDEARPVMRHDYPDDAWRLAWLDAVEAECRWRSGEADAARALLERAAPVVLARWGPATLFGAEIVRRQDEIGG